MHQAEPASTPGTKIYSGKAAVSRLRQLCGVSPEIFANAARRGHEARDGLLPVHPKTYPGQAMWAETTAALRLQLLARQQGWRIGQENNYETVFNPTRTIAIVVVGGDVNTGVRGFAHPKAKRPRGPITAKRVTRNHQLALDLEGIVPPDDTPDTDLPIWFYLLHGRQGMLYSELSSPVDIGENRRVASWSERILFGPLQLEGVITPLSPDQEPDEPPAVPVGRKS